MNETQWIIFLAAAWLGLVAGLTWQFGAWGLIAVSGLSIIVGLLIDPKEVEQ